MVFLVALYPPPPTYHLDNTETGVVYSDKFSASDYTSTSAEGIYYIQESDPVLVSTSLTIDESPVFCRLFDWFHCWWDGEDTEWWPHDPRECARSLFHAKARLRYPVGED